MATSGDCLHNSSNDTELYESYDEFVLSKDLNIDEAYRIKYTVNTINGMTISSPRYRVMQKLSIDPDIWLRKNVFSVFNSDNALLKAIKVLLLVKYAWISLPTNIDTNTNNIASEKPILVLLFILYLLKKLVKDNIYMKNNKNKIIYNL